MIITLITIRIEVAHNDNDNNTITLITIQFLNTVLDVAIKNALKVCMEIASNKIQDC